MSARNPKRAGARRTPTASARTGERILDAAQRLFTDEGGAAFSTRRVARAARVSLGSLQHFFPTRERLLQAMLEKVLADYARRYEEATATLPFNGEARLLAVIDLLVEDACRRETRKLFMNLNALSCHHPYVARLMRDLYAHHRRRIATYVGAARPRLSERQCLRHGLEIAALIDGLMVYATAGARDLAPIRQLARSIGATALRIISS